MAFRDLFKKKSKKEENNNMTTLEEVRKAYEDLSEDDKKSFHQSLADRVHESIAAQEREHGQEDSQSAEAREHEALGEEYAEGKGDTEELYEKDDTAEEKKEDAVDEAKEEIHEERQDDGMKDILARLDALEARFRTEDDTDEKAVKEAEKVYGLCNGIFETAKTEDGKVNSKEAAAIAKKLKP